MTRTPVALAVALVAGISSPAVAQARCEPARCLEAIRARADARLATLPAADVPGLWTNGDGGLSGEKLHLFPDGSYVYTEWADIQPETIYDKGTWRFDAGVLLLSPDADITWTQTWDRRYLLVRLGPDGGSPVLIGIDDALRRFEALVIGNPETRPIRWLEVMALVRRRSLDEPGSRFLKAGLFPGAWRPGWFADLDSETTRRSHAQLERALDIVDKADHVEAVAAMPVRINRTTGRSLSDLLILFEWNGGSLASCLFAPDVTFLFVEGDRSAQVQVSFACGEMVLDGVDGPAGGRKVLEDWQRREFLDAARKAFPAKFDRVRQ